MNPYREEEYQSQPRPSGRRGRTSNNAQYSQENSASAQSSRDQKYPRSIHNYKTEVATIPSNTGYQAPCYTPTSEYPVDGNYEVAYAPTSEYYGQQLQAFYDDQQGGGLPSYPVSYQGTRKPCSQPAESYGFVDEVDEPSEQAGQCYTDPYGFGEPRPSPHYPAPMVDPAELIDHVARMRLSDRERGEVEAEYGEEKVVEEVVRDGDQTEDGGNESDDYEADFKKWKPFKDFSWDWTTRTTNQVNRGCAGILDPAADWRKKTQHALNVLQPIISENESRFAGGLTWIKPELEAIFQEVASCPPDGIWKLAKNRYIHNPDVKVDIYREPLQYCQHEADNCSCWFDVTAGAGIKNFPAQHRRRKECIAFTSSLVVELLLRLAIYGEENGLFTEAGNPKEVIDTVPELTLGETVADDLDDSDESDSDSSVDSDECVDDRERQDFLMLDSGLVTMSNGNLHTWARHQEMVMEKLLEERLKEIGFDDSSEDEDDAEDGEAEGGEDGEEAGEAEGEEETVYPPPTPAQTHFARILAIIGRRALTLGICRLQKGQLFAERVPIHFWKFNDIAGDLAVRGPRQGLLDEYLERSGRDELEPPRYPIRVVNTHTLEFEHDKMLFCKNYAILSHMWGKGEVKYDSAEKLWASAREQGIDDELETIAREMNDRQSKARKDRSRKLMQELEKRKAVLEDEKADIVKARKKKMAEEAVAKGKPPPAAASDIPKPEGRAGEGLQRKPTVNRTGTAGGAKTADNPGEVKLMKAIRTAKDMGYEYLWSDTCCINKADSSELAESISSMGDWYQNAAVCLIYLHDVDNRDQEKMAKAITPLGKVQGTTKWAERGWTLQEAVMCRRAVFFNKHWNQIFDSKNDKASKRIAQFCRTPMDLLWHGKKPEIAASAVLAIAASRKTTRPEDRAYSLMGILGVRMPADYGEGQDKAIARLLEYIIRTTSDVSVFNWGGLYTGSRRPGRSMYPADFAGYRDRKAAASLPKPQHANSEITLGHSGVHARYDIWQAEFIVNGGNNEALSALNHLDAHLSKTSPAPSPKLDFPCSVEGAFYRNDRSKPSHPPLKIHVACSRNTLRKQLTAAQESKRGRPMTSNWVLARFAGLPGAKWFLAELQYDTQIADNGLFSHVFGGGGIGAGGGSVSGGGRQQGRKTTTGVGVFGAAGGDEGLGNFMYYLENRGFLAKRIEAKFEQKDTPTVADQNMYLWVG